MIVWVHMHTMDQLINIRIPVGTNRVVSGRADVPRSECSLFVVGHGGLALSTCLLQDLEDLKDVMVLTGKEQDDMVESKAAKRLIKRVDRLIHQADSVIVELQAEKEKMQVTKLEGKQKGRCMCVHECIHVYVYSCARVHACICTPNP